MNDTQPKKGPLPTPAERLRSRFPRLYALPPARFNALVAAAVRLGIERGDFRKVELPVPGEEEECGAACLSCPSGRRAADRAG